jgi:hypothetical protein
MDSTIYECKICREESDSLEGFISPCCCIGSLGHVHKECLNIWLRDSHGSDKYLQCQDCHCKYKRKEITEQDSRIDSDLAVSGTAVILLLSFGLLITMLIIGLSSIICIFVLYIIYVFFICKAMDNDLQVHPLLTLIIFLCILWSGDKIRNFLTDILLLIVYLYIGHDIVTDKWNRMRRIISAKYNTKDKTYIYDNYLKIFVTGVV